MKDRARAREGGGEREKESTRARASESSTRLHTLASIEAAVDDKDLAADDGCDRQRLEELRDKTY